MAFARVPAIARAQVVMRASPALEPSKSTKELAALARRAETIVLEYIKRQIRGVSKLRWVANLSEKPGWDVEYLNGDGDLVAVEVKGTTASEFSSFELTANELQACRRPEERYWLYLVAGCGGTTPSVQCIQLAHCLNEDRIALTPVRWQAQFL